MGSVLDFQQILAARLSQGWKCQTSRTDPIGSPSDLDGTHRGRRGTTFGRESPFSRRSFTTCPGAAPSSALASEQRKPDASAVDRVPAGGVRSLQSGNACGQRVCQGRVRHHQQAWSGTAQEGLGLGFVGEMPHPWAVVGAQVPVHAGLVEADGGDGAAGTEERGCDALLGAMGSVLDFQQILAARLSQGWKCQTSRTDPIGSSTGTTSPTA